MAEKISGQEGPVAAPSFFSRVGELIQKKPKLAILVASGLIVIVIFLVAEYFWVRLRADRGLSDIETAEDVRSLEQLKEKYKDSPDILTRVLYRLGSALYASDRLEEAKQAFEEFKRAAKKNHPLFRNVEQVVISIERDQAFLEKDKPAMVAQAGLLVHPSLHKERGDKPLYGPHMDPSPQRLLEFGAGQMAADFFTDDAPKSAASLLALLDKEYFRDVKAAKRSDGKGWHMEEKKTNPNTDELEFEPTSLPISKGTIALVRKENGKNAAARFQIFTEDAPELQGQVTVVGQITGNLEALNAFAPDETFRSSRPLRRR